MPPQIACPDHDSLRLLVQGNLPADALADLEKHVLGCDECGQAVDRFCSDETLIAGIKAQATTPLTIDPRAETRVRQLRQKAAANELTGPFSVGDTAAPLSPQGSSSPTANPASVSDAEFQFLAPPQAPDEIGRLGPYRVLQVLGKGGMGVVFKAEVSRLDRLIALKAMLPEIARRPDMKERFLREARAAAKIEHDNIIPIYQVDEDRGVPFIAMPFLKGASLEDFLKQKNKGGAALTVPQILKLAREITRGLAAAHDKGMIHRDIKPANIWLDGSAGGRVKILDFGLARLAAAAGDQHLTQSGAILGTPSYMAPEQARAEKLDGRPDLFSLGVVLYRLCTGELPFKGSDPISTLMALATHDPPPPAQINPAIPGPLSDLVMRLLAKDPAQRAASASQVFKELQAVAAALPTAAAPPASAVSSASVAPSLATDEQANSREVTLARGGMAPALPPGAAHGAPSHKPKPKSVAASSGKAGAMPLRPPFYRRPAAIAVMAGAAAIIVAAVFYLVTDKGTIKVEIHDPQIKVELAGDGLIFNGAGEQPIQTEAVTTGSKLIKVSRGDFNFETDKLVIKRGDAVTLEVTLLDGEVLVKNKATGEELER